MNYRFSPVFRRIASEPGTGYPLLCGLVAAVAFCFTWATGHRGINFLDQSIIFDGGWRILQGQRPYRDFLMPFGPVTFWIQAIFFRLFGINWAATVLPACVIDALATLSVIRIVRLLGGGSRALALCAGLATAISFQAPFGTLWLEQTAMFFALLALQAAVESLQASGLQRVFWQSAAGVLLALSMLSKQNYGAFFVPVVFAAALLGLVPDWRSAFRAGLIIGSGIAAALVLFLGWVWVFSDFPAFLRSVIVTAGEIGRSRLTLRKLVEAFSFNIVPNVFQFDLIGMVGGAIGLGLAALNFHRPIWRELAPASAVAMLLPWYCSFTQATTLNEWENDFAFVGLAACLGLGLLFRVADCIQVVPTGVDKWKLQIPSARTCKIGLAAACGVWGVLVFGFEARSAWQRKVQEFEAGDTFHSPVHVHGLEGVRWGEPTRIDLGARTLQRRDLEALAAYLAARKTGFFVMGDSTMLYGLLGVPSPQPLLYFQLSHSFLERDIPRLDELISLSLERHGVSLVVREKATWMEEQIFPRFPRISGWLTANFRHVTDFGNYEIWEQMPTDPNEPGRTGPATVRGPG